MSDQRALLAAIRENPDDRTLRLVYADWLEETGTPENVARAEFIRGFHEILEIGHRYTRPPDSVRYEQLDARQKQLQAEYGERWLAGFPKPAKQPVFTLGFLTWIELSAAACLAAPRPPWEREPLAIVSLSGPTFLLRTLLATGWLDGVYELDLNPEIDGTEDELAATVAYSACAPTLHGLSMWAPGLRDKGALALTAGNRFGRLGKLSLAGAFTAAAWSALANAPFADQLTNLALGYRMQTGAGTPPGMPAGAALARAPRLAGLRSLWVDHAAIGPDGLRELAAAPHLAGLERFNLDGDRLDHTAGRALADGLPAVTHLSVTSSRLPDAAVEVLADSPVMARLTGLRLTRNPLTPAAARALAQGRQATKLEDLDLSFVPLGDEGVAALARSESFPALRRLSLWSVDLTDRGADAVLNATWADQLSTLFLSHNHDLSPAKWDQLKERFGAVLYISQK